MEEEQVNLEESQDSTEAEATSSAEAGEVEGLPGEEASPAEPSTPAQVDEETIRQNIEEELRKEYDKRLHGLQSAKDREIAKVRREAQKLREAQIQQADALMESDPAKAAELYRDSAQATSQAQAVEQLYSEWQEWSTAQVEAMGLDPTDEAIQPLLTDGVQDLHQQSLAGNGPNAALAWQSELFKTKLEQEQKARTTAEKKQAELEENLPTIIDKSITRWATKAGLSPEVTEGGGPPRDKEVDYTKMSKAERDLHARKARQEELKKLGIR